MACLHFKAGLKTSFAESRLTIITSLCAAALIEALFAFTSFTSLIFGADFCAFCFVSSFAGVEFLSSASDTLQVKLKARLLQRTARLVEHIFVDRILAGSKVGLL